MQNTKKGLHPQNRHHGAYDFKALMQSMPGLSCYVKPNQHGTLSIDFADPLAVKYLNMAILKYDYHIDSWTIPQGSLCPPIPGRVDYIHYVAELLNSELPIGKIRHHTIGLLDIGTGASGIYPLLACQTYGWDCVGSDINQASLDNLAQILTHNPNLQGSLVLRLQDNVHHIFQGVIKAGEYFDVSVCNPPFHASLPEALQANRRKRHNLAQSTFTELNFGGLNNELWCNGGEQLFLKKMIKESKIYASSVGWFTCLVSKKDNIKPAQKLIRKLGALDCKEIEMVQGHKKTRILAWTYDARKAQCSSKV